MMRLYTGLLLIEPNGAEACRSGCSWTADFTSREIEAMQRIDRAVVPRIAISRHSNHSLIEVRIAEIVNAG
jgi:hypothetical protein